MIGAGDCSADADLQPTATTGGEPDPLAEAR